MYTTLTITFGDRGENHKGNQIIGEKAEIGFTLEDLNRAKKWFETRGIECSIYNLTEFAEKTNVEPAYLLVAKNGLSAICDTDEFYKEQMSLTKDKRALMRGKVKNKLARHNLCFSDESQKPDYEAGKGTIVAWSDVPILDKVHDTLPEIIGPVGQGMIGEGNYYYDPKTTGIGYHGDSERCKVIAFRAGVDMKLVYQWFYQSEPIGKQFQIILGHGDCYIMSSKSVGTDWMKRNIPTLRHAAGCDKYTTYKSKK
jgi:hypothetical protein